MAAPRLESDHPGLRIVADVASIFAAGFASEDALIQVVTTLRRDLALRRCRLWLRHPSGIGFTPLTSPGDESVLPGFTPPVAEWIEQGTRSDTAPSGLLLLRLPLVHENQALGLLETMIPEGRFQGMAHDVLVVVARILAPVIAATELSQDLASEVALRAREVETQRGFAAQIVDSLPVGLYVIDRGYRIRAWNRKRETGTQGVSRDDAVGREIFDVLDRQPRELLKREFDRVFDTGEMQQMEMESRASGDIRYYRITKIPMRQDGADITHVITIGEDITEWREAQHRLAETEKMAAVGQLAAGVMHEINNPLATILACSEALTLRTEDLPPGSRSAFEEYLMIIDTEVQRCRRIVDGLLDFSRPKSGEKRPVDVNALVEQTLFLLKHHHRFKLVAVARDLAPGLPKVRADGERLIQSFMALMLNAMDAMNARGALTVRTRLNPDRRDELLLEFIDTGVGIKQDDLVKIFEPFFTTKPPGRGTGLGLSICYAIVAELRGRIEVESQVGMGSNFKVFLPTG
jgi:two-component system NtrC family sensor kinase